MKTVVSLQELLEVEIRPDALIEEYRRQLARDLADYWVEPLHDVGCPACAATGGVEAFRRFGVRYAECPACGSLYASPRPQESAAVGFYRSAPSATFWREQMWPRTERARREKVVAPRVDWVLDGLAEYGDGAKVGLDLTPYSGSFAQELSADGERRIIAGSWTADLDVSPDGQRVRVHPMTIDTLPEVGPVDFVTAFDVLDRAPDVPALVHALRRVMRPGGLLFMSVPNADGFEVQVLWDRMPSLTPPDRLNLLSIEGLQRRFAAPDWELLEISTPGVFDIEVVRRVVEAHPDADWPRFVRRMIRRRGQAADGDFQEYLQRHRLASFSRVLVRRLPDGIAV